MTSKTSLLLLRCLQVPFNHHFLQNQEKGDYIFLINEFPGAWQRRTWSLKGFLNGRSSGELDLSLCTFNYTRPAGLQLLQSWEPRPRAEHTSRPARLKAAQCYPTETEGQWEASKGREDHRHIQEGFCFVFFPLNRLRFQGCLETFPAAVQPGACLHTVFWSG